MSGPDNVQPIRPATDEPWRLPLIDTIEWITAEPPARRWIVDGWLARGTGALMVGEDGVGKSLLAQQLVTAVWAGKPFLGLPTVQAPTLYVTCEDDAHELHRRQRTINRALGIPIGAAPSGLSTLVGMLGVELTGLDDDGTVVPSDCFNGIAAAAKAIGAGLIVLDNLAHLFPGNENVRREVAAFCSALDRLAIDCDATVLMLAHPSKGGAEYSGSTGWSAHVRQRWWLERPASEVDRDARVLRKSKANYSEAGTELTFRWHDWAFVRAEDLGEDAVAELAAAAGAAHDNAAFLDCLAKATFDHRAVSHVNGTNYAPRIFARMIEAKGVKVERFAAAMERLLHLGTIRLEQPLWRGANRVMKQGIKLASDCTDPPASTPCTDLHAPPAESGGNPCTDPCTTPPLYTSYKQGGPSEAPPFSDPDDITWPDMAETGEEE